MKNGDRITCEIKGRANTLYSGVPHVLGTLSVASSRVDHLESKQWFMVRTRDRTVYPGATMETSCEQLSQIKGLGRTGEKGCTQTEDGR